MPFNFCPIKFEIFNSKLIYFTVSHNTTIPSQMDLNISEVLVHEDLVWVEDLVWHSYKMLWNDIALLKLVQPLNYTPEVQPVCLSKHFSESNNCTNLNSTQCELAREKMRAEVVGYGKTEFSPPFTSPNNTRWPTEIVHRGLMRFMCPEVTYLSNHWKLARKIDAHTKMLLTIPGDIKIRSIGTRDDLLSLYPANFFVCFNFKRCYIIS